MYFLCIDIYHPKEADSDDEYFETYTDEELMVWRATFDAYRGDNEHIMADQFEEMALVGVTTLEWNLQKFNNIVASPYQNLQFDTNTFEKFSNLLLPIYYKFEKFYTTNVIIPRPKRNLSSRDRMECT